jgi:hypothetical protein
MLVFYIGKLLELIIYYLDFQDLYYIENVQKYYSSYFLG